jgi:hypothetical protein
MRMLTDPARRQLQRLRFMLEDALGRSQDPTEQGRHSAIVLLDGACEHAMGIALGHRGKSIPRQFPQKFDALQDALGDWQPDSWAAVLQLHEARNQAQHHGTVPDASNMPTWAAQGQRFIDSLVAAVFNVDLSTVLLAEAVEIEDVRSLLVEAEQATQQQDAAAAFQAAIAGFDAAREAWRGQRADAIGHIRLQYSGLSHLVGGVETDPINLSLLRFEDLLEVQPFAQDIGEYHWLIARRSEVEQKIVPTLEVAQRAFRFVVAWVLRWEAFAARYSARQYPPPPPPYEPPVTGGDRPVVFDAIVDLQHQVGNWIDQPSIDTIRYAVRMTLADLPDGDRERWARRVGDVLNELIAARGFDHVGSANIDDRGIVRFHAVSAHVSGAEIHAWIDQALVEGEKRYQAEMSEHQQREESLPDLMSGFQAAVGAADTDQLVARLTSLQRDDGSVWIGVHLRRDEHDPMLGHLLDNVVQAVRSGRSGVDYSDTTIWFEGGFDPGEARRVLEGIAANYAEQAATRRRVLVEIEARRHALESELRRLSIDG